MPENWKILLCSWLFFGSLFLPDYAAAAAVSSFLQRIEAAAAETDSFSCDFIQEKHLAMFEKPVMFNGTLAIVRPDKLRWEFKEPLPSALILNGEKGLRCDGEAPPQTFTLGTDPIMKVVAEQLWSWLGGNYTRLEETYAMEITEETTLKLTPKEKMIADFIADIAISFDRTTLRPTTVEIKEASGDTTMLRFSGYRLNIRPEKDFFSSCDIRE